MRPRFNIALFLTWTRIAAIPMGGYVKWVDDENGASMPMRERLEKMTPEERAEELRIDWSQPAVQTHRLVRLGGAWTTFRGKRVKVLAAELADAAGVPPTPGLRLVTVQPEGKGPMAFDDFVRGARPQADERFE